MEIFSLGDVRHFTSIPDELSFGYTLVPLSLFLDMLDFLDINDVTGIMHFKDIMLSAAGGVGWGVKSLWVSEAS